jgi:TRAP-type transport system periplasmic protein
MMNTSSYEGLPDELRTVIDEASGDALVSRFGRWWDERDRPGRKDAIACRNTITKLSPQERQAWITALQPMIDSWLDGLANPREISAEAHKLVAHYGKA